MAVPRAPVGHFDVWTAVDAVREGRDGTRVAEKAPRGALPARVSGPRETRLPRAGSSEGDHGESDYAKPVLSMASQVLKKRSSVGW
jgi:hypothetical protein